MERTGGALLLAIIFTAPASGQSMTPSCGTYHWPYPDHGLFAGAEDHYLVLRCEEEGIRGWYYGTSDDFDGAREGYTPGYYVQEAGSLEVSSRQIRFALSMPEPDYFDAPVPLQYRSHDQVPDGLLPRFPHRTAYGLTREFRGVASSDSIRFEVPWDPLSERTFVRIGDAPSNSDDASTPPPPLVGVVELPAIFQPEQSPRSLPVEQAIPVHTSPDASSPLVGTIRFAHDVESIEFDYEFRGALAYGRSSDWVLVALPGDTASLGWIPPDHTGTLHSLDTLFLGRLAYLTSEWSGELRVSPSYRAVNAPLPQNATTEVDVVGAVARRDGVWLRVQVLGPGRCEGDPAVVAEGWVPALTLSGRRAVWHHSRGC